jgi:hypothetical protein
VDLPDPEGPRKATRSPGSICRSTPWRATASWPEALKAISGEDRIDGGALLEYFAPLKAWLDEQNRLLATQQKG